MWYAMEAMVSAADLEVILPPKVTTEWKRIERK